jgi:hypothetical protein
MSNLNLIPKKKIVNVGISAIALIVIIAGAASFYCLSDVNASPTMSSLAGTYSSTTGYTIVLYENGTGLFSSHSGTWSIVNSTTFEGTYSIISTRTDYFTIINNGFIAVGTGNVYVKTTSISPTPTVPDVPYCTLELALILGVATVIMLVFKKYLMLFSHSPKINAPQGKKGNHRFLKN